MGTMLAYQTCNSDKNPVGVIEDIRQDHHRKTLDHKATKGNTPRAAEVSGLATEVATNDLEEIPDNPHHAQLHGRQVPGCLRGVRFLWDMPESAVRSRNRKTVYYEYVDTELLNTKDTSEGLTSTELSYQHVSKVFRYIR